MDAVTGPQSDGDAEEELGLLHNGSTREALELEADSSEALSGRRAARLALQASGSQPERPAGAVWHAFRPHTVILQRI